MKTCKKCGTDHGQHTPGCAACYMREVYYKRPGAAEKRRNTNKQYYAATKNDPQKVASRQRWKDAHPDEVRAVNRRAQAKYKARMQEIVDAAKAAPCADCGAQYPPRAMDLHHRDPADKLFTVASLLSGRVESPPAGTGKPREQLLREEIAKCEVLCAVCHRLHHGV